ncbi:MAG: hypothetical protein IKW20_06580 [Bacteroidales bacterium]|nr:hypothetical protein [Bacteroidales bacterium]
MEEEVTIYDMCPYCEEEVEIPFTRSDIECPNCWMHFTPSDEAITDALIEYGYERVNTGKKQTHP